MKLVRTITIALALAFFGGVLNAPLQAWGEAKSSKADLVDINHANAAQLRALPGIGEAYAAAIIKHRPYKNKSQLLSGGVIPEAVYKKIRDKIIAKQ
jgi:DNA uptake protein ComE-like DNA-binding protein